MGIAVLCLYALVIFGAAFRTFLRKSERGDTTASGTGPAFDSERSSFFVNGRSSGAVGVALSIIVSCVGASATIGVIGLAFEVGTPAFWWLGAGCVGLSMLSLLLARKVRDSGAFTMPQLVSSFLGQKSRPLISAIVVIAWTAILAAQFTAITGVLEGLTGFSAPVCRAVSFGLIVVHSFGGQAAVMRADRVQAFILLAALLAFIVWLSGHNPAWICQVEINAVSIGFPTEKLLHYLFVVGANYLVCPMLFGRFLSAESGGQARRGGLMAVAGLLLFSMIIVAIGLACQGIVPLGTPGDSVLAEALKIAPAWMNLFISIALVSAIVSSADSCLVTAGTVLAQDIFRRSDVRSGQICVLFLGLAGLSLSLWGKGILDYLLMAYDVYACGVVVPVFIGLILDKTYRIESSYAVTAVLAGGTLGLVSALSGINEFSFAGLILAGLVSLFGLKPKVP